MCKTIFGPYCLYQQFQADYGIANNSFRSFELVHLGQLGQLDLNGISPILRRKICLRCAKLKLKR